MAALAPLSALERQAAVAVAALTAATGAAQLAAPVLLLGLLARSPPSAAEAHLFATVGMFMVTVGAMLLHAMRRGAPLAAILPWSAFQKLAAALLVGWGVRQGLFVPAALLVVALDAASALLFIHLWRKGA